MHKRNLNLTKIVEMAGQIITNQGLTAMTMPNLAQALDVRSQSLYHYVSGRKELLSLVGAARIKAMHQKLVDGLLGFSGKSALVKLADLVRDFILHDPALFSILYHLNEYTSEDAITKEINSIIRLAAKFKLDNNRPVSAHTLIGAVLGYVFLDRTTLFPDENTQQTDKNYQQMILSLVG